MKKPAKSYGSGWVKIIWFIAIVLLAVIILNPANFSALERFIAESGNWGYVGAAIAGFFFAYGLTIPVSTISLYALGGTLNPVLVSLIAATAATAGDFIIFKIGKKRLAPQIERLEKRGSIAKYAKKWGKWIHRFAPLLAGFIIASPLPDELAALLLGSLKFTEKQFVVFVWSAEFLGILAITLLGSALI